MPDGTNMPKNNPRRDTYSIVKAKTKCWLNGFGLDL